jgi:small subunit ribosomal protein S19
MISKKDFTYRGKKIEELKTMDTREFAKLVKSRPRRAILRQFNEIENFIVDCMAKTEKEKQIKTHLRHLVIVPKMVGYKLGIYNGKTFVPVEIVPQMLGHRLGEFSVTRSKVAHGAAGIGATRSSLAKATRK